jgi:hypothetical protein
VAVPGHGGVLWPTGSAGKHSFLYLPGGDVVGRLHARMGGPVQVVKYLPTDFPGHQWLEHAFGSFTDEVQMAN